MVLFSSAKSIQFFNKKALINEFCSSCIIKLAILQSLVFLARKPLSCRLCKVSDKQSDLQAHLWPDLDVPQEGFRKTTMSAVRPCWLSEESQECMKAHTPIVKQNRTLVPCINANEVSVCLCEAVD